MVNIGFCTNPYTFHTLGICFSCRLYYRNHRKTLSSCFTSPSRTFTRTFWAFTIIVLGEAIIAVVNGVSEQKWDVQSAISAMFGFGIAFSLWWIYFENVSGSILSSNVDRKVGLI